MLFFSLLCVSHKGMATLPRFPNFEEKQHCILVSSRTDLDDDVVDVVDVTSLSALDVVKHCILLVTMS